MRCVVYAQKEWVMIINVFKVTLTSKVSPALICTASGGYILSSQFPPYRLSIVHPVVRFAC